MKKKAFKAALPHTLPICVGFLFLGMSYGFMMRSKGFSFVYPLFMSMFIFAGSMEFVTANLLLSAFILHLGKVLPYAVIGLLIVYCLKEVPTSGTYGLPEAIAILFIVFLHKWKKNTLLSIGGGTILYMLLVQRVF